MDGVCGSPPAPEPGPGPAFQCDVFDDFPDEPPEQEDADWLPPCPDPPFTPPGQLIVTNVVIGGPSGVAAPASAFGFTITQGGAPMPPFAEQFPGAGGTTTFSIPFTATVTVEETTTLPDYVTDDSNCANLQVARGLTTTCTVTNTYVPPPPPPPAVLRIEKQTSDGSASIPFTFTHPTQGLAGAFELTNDQIRSFELEGGVYQVTEFDLPTGWVLQDITCLGGADDGDALQNTITIDLAPGEDVTCTFTNQAPPPAPPPPSGNPGLDLDVDLGNGGLSATGLTAAELQIAQALHIEVNTGITGPTAWRTWATSHWSTSRSSMTPAPPSI